MAAVTTETGLTIRARSGGRAVLAKYGRDFYVAIGRRGGRPRALTIEDLETPRQGLKSPCKDIELRKGVGRPPGSRALKRLLARRRRSG